MYKLSQFEGCIIRLIDGAIIPEDVNNMDYQAYLIWIGEGGVTEPPDPLPEGTVPETFLVSIRPELLG